MFTTGVRTRMRPILWTLALSALLAAALSSCSLPWSSTRSDHTPIKFPPTSVAQTSSCPPATAHDVLLHGGANNALTVRSIDAEELRFVQTTSTTTTDMSAVWETDVVSTDPGLLDFPALTAAVGRSTPQDFGCVVAEMQRAHVTQLALQALQTDATVLPGPPTTVMLFAAPLPVWYTNITQSWDSGFSGPGAIAIYLWAPTPQVAADESNPARDWWSGLSHTVAHEYFEVVRYQQIGFTPAYTNLLGNLVTDGMAESFAAQRTGQDSHFDHVLTASQEAALWSQISPQLASTDRTLDQSVMFGSPAQGIPGDAGYCIGFHIVQGYLKRHPNTTFATLAGLDAQTVYAQSGYTG